MTWYWRPNGSNLCKYVIFLQQGSELLLPRRNRFDSARFEILPRQGQKNSGTRGQRINGKRVNEINYWLRKLSWIGKEVKTGDQWDQTTDGDSQRWGRRHSEQCCMSSFIISEAGHLWAIRPMVWLWRSLELKKLFCWRNNHLCEY